MHNLTKPQTIFIWHQRANLGLVNINSGLNWTDNSLGLVILDRWLSRIRGRRWQEKGESCQLDLAEHSRKLIFYRFSCTVAICISPGHKLAGNGAAWEILSWILRPSSTLATVVETMGNTTPWISGFLCLLSPHTIPLTLLEAHLLRKNQAIRLVHFFLSFGPQEEIDRNLVNFTT